MTFDALGDQRTRVAISLEWQRDDAAEAYVPLILLDGVQVNTNLRDFKREVERDSAFRLSAHLWRHPSAM